GLQALGGDDPQRLAGTTRLICQPELIVCMAKAHREGGCALRKKHRFICCGYKSDGSFFAPSTLSLLDKPRVFETFTCAPLSFSDAAGRLIFLAYVAQYCTRRGKEID